MHDSKNWSAAIFAPKTRWHFCCFSATAKTSRQKKWHPWIPAIPKCPEEMKRRTKVMVQNGAIFFKCPSTIQVLELWMLYLAIDLTKMIMISPNWLDWAGRRTSSELLRRSKQQTLQLLIRSQKTKRSLPMKKNIAAISYSFDIRNCEIGRPLDYLLVHNLHSHSAFYTLFFWNSY